MRISLVRTGGVAGVRREASIDTATLEPERGDRLRRLLEAADLESLSASEEGAGRPDRFRYALTVEAEDGRDRKVVFGEEEASERVQRLLEALWREAETEPPDIRRV